MKKILRDYERASRPKINIEKSAVLFSTNIPCQMRESIMANLGISKMLTKDKYLGLPIMVGKAKRKEFQLMKDRLWKRLR